MSRAIGIGIGLAFGGTPYGPAGMAPALDLNLANGLGLDPRVTFTRASKGWATNSLGLIAEFATNAPRFDHDPVTLAPRGLLIEEARTNLLTYSERFDNAAWLKLSNALVSPNKGTSPDGNFSADILQFTGDSSAAVHQLYVNAAGGGVSYTMSVWVKSGTGSSQTFRLKNTHAGVLDNFSSDLTATTEWQRFSLSVTNGAAAGSGQYGGVVGRTAGGAHDLLVWGAQLEVGAFATSYIPSTDSFTSRASTATYFDSAGVMQTAAINVPRYGFAYDSASGTWVSTGLILEAAATNLLLNSATLVTQDITTTAAARTLSFYGTGTVTLSGTHSATVVGTGAYPTSRKTYTYTPTAGTLTLTVTGAVVYAQDELGSVATSWISTAGSAVTRAADVSSSAATTRAVSDATHTIAAMAEGTVVVEYQANASGTRPILSFDDNSANNSIVLRTVGTDPKFTVTNGGVAQADIDAGTVASGAFYKIAAVWKVNDFAVSVNGAAVVADTSGAIPTFDRMRLGGNQAGDKLNGTIRSVRVYATRLPDATLQALTA